MKKTFIKSALLAAITAGTFTSCVNGDDYQIPNMACTETSLVKNKEVQDIPATATVAQYTGNDVIEAYVTSSDEGGNFYKSISFQTLDGSKGFSVPVDVTSTFTNIEPGRKVMIKMEDLYTDVSYGGMRIGGIYVSTSGTASVGRLAEADYKKALNRSCTVVSEEQLVKHVTINQAKTDAMLNILVELDDVQFSDDAITKNYYDPANDIGGATNHLLQDANGNSVIFRTSSFANFAYKPVATGRGKVRGVMTKYGTDYQFIARTERDVNMTLPRRMSLFNESFTTNFPTWTKFSVVGAQVWTLDATFGNPGACAKMSGYASGNQNNEDWLISPNINLTTISSAVLTFDTATKFAGNTLEIYVSTNYTDGANPSTATWVQQTATLSPSTGSYVWTGSGPVNLAAFVGQNIHIAFKYSSTTAAAATWEVDNVKVVGN